LLPQYKAVLYIFTRSVVISTGFAVIVLLGRFLKMLFWKAVAGVATIGGAL
jgi:hypothetical protein